MLIPGFFWRVGNMRQPDEHKRQQYYCICAGKLSRDAEETCHRVPLVTVCLNYARKRFLNCYFRKESPFYDVARDLIRGEWCFVLGVATITPYTTRKGEEKENVSMYPGFLIPAGTILAAHRALRKRRAMLPEDVMYAANEYIDVKEPDEERFQSDAEESDESDMVELEPDAPEEDPVSDYFSFI